MSSIAKSGFNDHWDHHPGEAPKPVAGTLSQNPDSMVVKDLRAPWVVCEKQAKRLSSLHYCPSDATTHNATCRRKAMRQD